MHSLDETLRICDKKSMINGILKYSDNIPYSTNDINENNYNYYIMKYYKGSISKEEHEKFKNGLYNNLSIGKIYNKYIFNSDNIFSTEFTIYDENIDDLIYLRMIISDESKYLDILNKLMIRIYFEKEKMQLAGLVQQLYEQYDWAKKYINEQKENKLSLIFQDSTDDYTKKFGICISEISSDDNTYKKGSEKIEEISKENNWILQKFGG